MREYRSYQFNINTVKDIPKINIFLAVFIPLIFANF
jgi:hypothetical protein